MDKKRLIILPLVFALFGFLRLSAQETITLTVDEAVNQAMKNSFSLKSAAIDLEIKKRTRDTAWNVFIPVISANGSVTRMNNVTTMDLSALLPGFPIPPSPKPLEADHWSVSGTLSAGLNLSIALIDGVKATFANYEAGLITWEQTLKETERDIRKMFFSILLIEGNMQLQEQSLENARQRWVQAQTNFKNGLAPELTVLQAQVAYENRKPIVLEVRQLLSQQLNVFAFLLGYPYGTVIKLAGSIRPQYMEVSARELIDTYLLNRFDVLSLKKNIQLLNIQLSASRLQTYTPALSLNYAYGPSLSPINKKWGNPDNWTDSRGAFSVTLAWNLTNMLPFSSNGVNMKNTALNIRKLEIGLDTVLQNAEMQINNLVNQLQKSGESIKVQELNVQLAKKAYDLTVLAFNAGTRELLDVRDAESQLNQAEIGLLQEKLNYITALLDLEYAVNQKLAK